MLRLSALVIASCLFLLSSFTSAQSSTGTSLFADTACNSNLCLRVIYSPSEKRMNMTMSANGGGAPIGWYAVGTGSKMNGSNMMIGWVDTSGNVVMSQRTAAGHNNPTTSISALAATLDSRQSSSNTSGTYWVWSFPMSSSDQVPTTSTPFIWAINKDDDPGSSPSSSIRRHTAQGQFTLDLTKPYNGASSSSGSTGSATPVTPSEVGGANSQATSNRTLNRSNRLVIVHMVFMILAWFILVPTAMLLARYGRTYFKWFPVHRGLMISAFVFVLIAFIVIVVQTSQANLPHFSSTHAQAGLAIFIIMFCQVLLGLVSHTTKRFNPSRIFHAIVGIGLFVTAVWNATEGFGLWQWNPPSSARWVLWIWFGIVAAAYLAGFALLPRELRRYRAEAGASEEKQEYLGLQHEASLGVASPGNSTQQHSPGEQSQMQSAWNEMPLQPAPSHAYETYQQSPTAQFGNRV